MDKHIDAAYDVEEGDRVKITTDEGFSMVATVEMAEFKHPGGPEVTAQVHRFELESDEEGSFFYVVNKDYGSDASYSELLDDNGGAVTKENYDEKSYGYIKELEKK